MPPLVGVLSTFQSPYSSLSVVQEYLALEGGPPTFSQSSTSSDLLDVDDALDAYGTVTRYGRPFQSVRLSLSSRLVRFRSPLLTESRLISFPPGT